MNARWILGLLPLLIIPPAMAVDKHEPSFNKVLLDRLEARDLDTGTLVAWDLSAWHGGDINKLYFATEGDYLTGAGDDNGTERAETRVAWNHAFASFWDWQLGARRDWKPDQPRRDWGSIGIQGLAPYRFEVDATLFIGEAGLSQLRLAAEYELLFTQRLILTPRLEANAYGKEDSSNGIGAGLTSLEGGLRLRYEIRRRFAPYIGVNWERQYGATADFSRAAGEDIQTTSLVAGIRAWY